MKCFVGLNYLIEFVPEDDGDSSIIWVCVLCGSTLTSDTLVKEHFTGKRHRYRYLVSEGIFFFFGKHAQKFAHLIKGSVQEMSEVNCFSVFLQSKYYPDLSKQVHAKDKNSDKFSLCASFATEVELKEGALR